MPAAKAQAVQALLALPQDQQDDAVARLLADLGADPRRLPASRPGLAITEYPGPSLFWYPDMRAILSDPGFPALATQLGLMNYWKTTRTRPDVCNEARIAAVLPDDLRSLAVELMSAMGRKRPLRQPRHLHLS